MELRGQKTLGLGIVDLYFSIVLKGKPELCVAEGENVTVPVGERKIGTSFSKWKQELLQYCRNSDKEEKQLVAENDGHTRGNQSSKKNDQADSQKKIFRY